MEYRIPRLEGSQKPLDLVPGFWMQLIHNTSCLIGYLWGLKSSSFLVLAVMKLWLSPMQCQSAFGKTLRNYFCLLCPNANNNILHKIWTIDFQRPLGGQSCMRTRGPTFQGKGHSNSHENMTQCPLHEMRKQSHILK